MTSLRSAAVLWLATSLLAAAEHHGVVRFGGLPLPGATVTVFPGNLTTITNQQGEYSFPDLPADASTIKVEMQCFQPLERDASTTEWDMKLLPLPAMNAVAAKSATQAFRKTEVAATAPSPATAPAPPETTETAADGFLINGSVNNGASSPFSLAAAFGNSRKGTGSQYNGSLSFTADNSALDARAFSLTGQDTTKPAYNRLTGFFSFGGPIKIPRLLPNGPNFIVNYQWTRDRNAYIQPGRMPTEEERNAIPPDLISPQAKELLSFYPFPNFSGSSRYNYQVALTGANHQDSLQTRLSKTIGRKDQFYGAVAYQSTRSDNENLFGFLDTTDSTGINSNVNWRHALTTHLSTTLGYQFSRLVTRITPYFANRANISGDAGITGNNQDPVNWGPPSLSFSGGISGLSDVNQSFTRNQTSGLSMAAYWNRGRHNVSFGGDVRRQQFNLLSQQNPRGSFTFTGQSTGSDFTSFLLGIPDTSAVAFGNADKYLRAWSNDAFVTDDWRISPGLTLNAGVRWEYGSPLTERYGRLVNLDIAPNFTTAAPVVNPVIQPDKNGFQPRIAVSWRPLPASSMVVRAGYGIYSNTSVYLNIATQMAQQSPLSKSVSVPNSPGHPLTLANGFNASGVTTPNTFSVDPNFRVGYAHNWQLSVQRDLPGALVMTATYLGIKGTRGVQIFLPNTYPSGAFDPCATCPRGFSYLTSNGNSISESGQVQLRRRLHRGLTGSLQYTFSKSIDNAALGGRGQGSPVIAQNWLDLSAERGLSNFDQRHALTWQIQYTTSMRLSGRLASLLKEWTVTSQVTAGSGLPLTPIYLAAVNGTGVTGSIRPDYTGASLYDAPSGLFLNPAAYAAPASGRWGNAGRNTIIGPNQFALSASLGRTFRIADRFSLDFRLDSANALNHVSFTSWNTTVTSNQFGLPTASNAMRTVQTTLRVRF